MNNINDENERKNNSLKSKKIENICGICRTMGVPPPCKGHGKAAGGDGGGGDSSDTEKKDDSPQPVKSHHKPFITPEKALWINTQLKGERTVDYEVGLLHVESDKLRGNLIFRFKPGLTKDDLEAVREFLNKVKIEFDEFKNHLNEQGVPIKNFNAVIKDNTLMIHIPNPKYFDAFIKQLENKNLLPIPNAGKQKKETLSTETDKQSKKRVTPFDDISKGPRPKGWKKNET